MAACQSKHTPPADLIFFLDINVKQTVLLQLPYRKTSLSLSLSLSLFISISLFSFRF